MMDYRAERLARRRVRQTIRYRHEPEFRRKKIQGNIDSQARKIQACPDYKNLVSIRKRISHLRTKISVLLDKVAGLEKELLTKVKERDQLASACRTVKPSRRQS